MPFSWKNQLLKYEIHLLARSKRLCVMNDDFMSKHPELSREAELGNTDVEIKKFVKKEVLKKQKYGKVPRSTLVAKRYNRVVG